MADALPEQPCHLCGTVAPLRQSHIIPDWVYRREIRNPKGGAMIDLTAQRTTGKAITLPLLCGDCEQMFSRWENEAAKLARSDEPEPAYGAWLLKFATSISWRVVTYFLMRPPDELSDNMRAILAKPYVTESLACWKQFLLTGTHHAASLNHRQHHYGVSKDYSLRKAITFTIHDDGEEVFVWSRFSAYGILGILDRKNKRSLRDSAIKVQGGNLLAEQRVSLPLIKALLALEDEGMRRLLIYAHRDHFRRLDEEDEPGTP